MSASGQAASTRCSTRTIVAARIARISASRARKAAAPAGSRLAVGSSSTRIPGSAASTPARASRCCWPPDRSRACRASNPASPTDARASGTRRRIRSSCQPRFSRPNATSSSTRSITIWTAGSWNTSPTAAASDAGSVADVSRPSTAREPVTVPGSSRGTRPATASPNVLLPDPDGPTTSRQSPGSSSTVTPWRAGPVAPRYVKPKSRARSAPGPGRADGGSVLVSPGTLRGRRSRAGPGRAGWRPPGAGAGRRSPSWSR